ncbi:MAG TPA: adenylate/guanylate cyclase domain-containing protein [Leptospiraceae bacterium]|nr:adenylate/guanylate cyclase domain-containing protein [Leptospiraceae bacterium]
MGIFSTKKEKTTASSITSKQSASFEIIFASLTVLVVSVMLVTGYSYYNNKNAILDLSEDVIDQINQRVFQNAKNYLMTAVDMTELSSKITVEGVETLDNNPRLDALMIAILKLHPQLKNFEIGNDNGDFLMQRREQDGTISTKVVTRKKGKVTVKWRRRDLEGKIIKEDLDTEDKYDPRERPWYQGAKREGKLFWSDVYIFATDKVPGVTASSPVRDKDGKFKGVFGLDIPLVAISEFLMNLKDELKNQNIGKKSIIYITNSKGEIVAFPDSSVPMILEEGKLRPRKVEESDFPEIKETYKYFYETKDSKFNLEVSGVKYLASYKEFPKKDFDKDWTIGLVVPEDDMIGPIKRTNSLLITVSGVILAGAMILGLIMFRLKKALDVRNRFIKETFGMYLSDEVVNSILETPEGTMLGGDKRIVTIMMTDLRGFTSIGERLPAESVVGMINIYLDIMTDIIFKYNGTIDEFIGDAILVIFGAPIQRDDDAQRAVACALEMQLAMDEVNRRNREAGFPEVQMGIGINTGDIVVGNIGSKKRMKYGVVGKNVNLTSRIESYTVGGQTLISPFTVDACKGLLRIDDQFEVMPKGVNTPITISAVGGIGGPFNVYMPEKKDAVLKKVKSKVHFEFNILAGKHASDDLHLGDLLELGEKEGILGTHIPVEKLNNIKILRVFINGKEYKTDLYAKVTQNISNAQLRINFTSVPPDSGSVLKDILGNHT